MPNWIQLTERRNWGSLDLDYEGRTLTARAGETVWVRWPDGHDGFYPIVMHRTDTSYSDMGHDHRCAADVPHVVDMLHGVAVAVKLTTPGLHVSEQWAREHLAPGFRW